MVSICVHFYLFNLPLVSECSDENDALLAIRCRHVCPTQQDSAAAYRAHEVSPSSKKRSSSPDNNNNEKMYIARP